MDTKKVTLTSLKLSKFIANCASDKKAIDIVVLDMRKVVNYCDYFVICSGNTDRMVKAIADHIDDELRKIGNKLAKNQISGKGDWVVIDAGDVVSHIFQKDIREFYKLEYLWQEAKVVKWETTSEASK